MEPYRVLAKLDWNMSKRDVQVAFRDLEALPPHPTQNAIGFVAKINGIESAVICYFRRAFLSEKLARCNIMVFENRPSDDQIMEQYELIKSHIVDHYGSPLDDSAKTDPDLTTSHLCVWRAKDRVISLSRGLEREGVRPDAPPLGIGCGDIKHDPVSRVWDY